MLFGVLARNGNEMTVAAGKCDAHCRVKSEAPGDSLDTPVEGCVTLFENDLETNGSWDTEEVVPPALPFGLKLVLVCTRLKAGGMLGPLVFTSKYGRGGP